MLPMFALVLGLSVAPPAPPPEADEPPALYVPGGRRDPFLPPGAAESRSPVCLGRGLEVFRVRELALRGLVRTPAGRLAMLAAPDQRSYFAAAGARLCDGTLEAVTPEGALFVEELDDQRGGARTRQVLRKLHP